MGTSSLKVKFAILCLATFSQVTSLTIRQRYIENGLFDPREKCKMLSSDLLERPGMQAPIYGAFYRSMVKWIEKTNCTVSPYEYSTTGVPDENGTYDGFVGVIQRNEANSAIAIVRPDSLPFEPGKIGSTLLVADAAILSKKKIKVQQTRDVMSVFVDVGRMMYIYTAYMMLIVAILITIGWKMCKVKDSFLFCIVKSLYELFWILFGVLHPSSRRSLASRRILLEATSLFGLSFIIGFLQNRVGSDLCVFFGEEDIQSLDDLLNDPKVLPWVSPRLFLYSILKSSQNGTKLFDLWQRILQNPKKSIEHFSDSQASIAISVKDITGEIKAGRMATLIAQPITWASKQFGCRYNPTLVDKTTIAPETFAPGHLAVLWSHQTPEYFMRGINYMFTTTLECGLWHGALFTSRLGEVLGALPVTVSTLRCQDGIIDNELEWEPFRLELYVGIFGLIASGWVLGFIFLILEILFKRYCVARKYKLFKMKLMRSLGMKSVSKNRSKNEINWSKLHLIHQSVYLAGAKKVINARNRLRHQTSKQNSLKGYL